MKNVLIKNLTFALIINVFLIIFTTNSQANNSSKNINTSFKKLTQQCQKGDIQACHNLGVMWLKGQGTTKDAKRANELFIQGCAKNVAESCFNAGVLSDEFNAFKFYKKSCELNYLPACEMTAQLYEKGEVTRQDIKKAITLYEKNCYNGLFNSCISGANIYENGGGGVRKDVVKMTALLEHACQQHFLNSCELLGNRLLQLGENQKGVDYLKQACQQENGSVCTHLGVIYTNGEVVKQDFSQAKEYFGLGCDFHDRKGCESYKFLNENGVE